MKKLAFFLIAFFTVAALWSQSPGTALFVAVRSVDVKSGSGFFARTLGTITLGDEVTLQQNQGRWHVIRNASGLQGWALADAFSTRRIVNTGQSVSANEFALAGKGFNNDLEAVLSNSGEFDFTRVDAMERRSIAPEELWAFITEGRLATGE
jgi:hypothetical protein